MKIMTNILAVAVVIASLHTLTYSAEVQATYTPKIKNIRIRQTSESAGPSHYLEVVTSDSVTSIVDEKGVADPYDVTVVVGKNTLLELEPTPLLRRVTTPLTLSGAALIDVTLMLLDANEQVLFKGLGRTSVGRPVYFASVVADKEVGFTVNQFLISKFAGRTDFGFSVDVSGDGSTEIVKAVMVTTEQTSSKVPVVREYIIADENISRERIYSRALQFSADPVGSVYEMDLLLTGEVDKEKLTTTIEMIRLPGADTLPGPILGVTGNGRGTRNSASNSQQTQQAELL